MTPIHAEVLDFFGAKAFASLLVSGRAAMGPVALEILELAADKVAQTVNRPVFDSRMQDEALALLAKGLASHGEAGLKAAVRAVYESVFENAGLSTADLYTTGLPPGPRTQEQRVSEKVRQCISDIVGAPPADVRTTSRLVADLGADSLDLVEIVMHVEDELHVEFSDEDAERVVTVQDAIDLAMAAIRKRQPL